MDNNIHLDAEGQRLVMRKTVWHEDEILLAHCFWFDVNEEAGVITAPLRSSFRKAVYSFMEVCFPYFVKGEQYETERKYLFDMIDTQYRVMYRSLSAIHKDRLPWYDRLWKHQKQGLVAMHNRNCTMVSMEPRLGKTITCCSHSVVHNVQRTLVVTYNIGKWNWMYDVLNEGRWGEERAFVKEEAFTILSRDKKTSKDAFRERFLICNYDSLGKYIPRIMDGIPIGHVIFSEAQRLKDHTTSTFKAAEKIVTALRGDDPTRSDLRLTFESGTPVTNRYNDMYAYFRLSGHPLGGSYSDFRRKYVETNSQYGSIVGSKNTDDLQIKMRNFIFRKTQAECTDIPAHRYENVYFNLNEEVTMADGTIFKVKDEYDKAIREAMTTTGRRVFESMIFSVNRIMAMAKVKGVIEHAEMLIEAGQKVVIFTGYTDPVLRFQKHFGERCVVIDGSKSDKEKVDESIRFMKDPSVQVCINNYRAAAHTIDLSASSHVILNDLPITGPKTIEQATDRVKNGNKTDHSYVYFCICRDDDEPTVDERMLDLATQKDADINALMDGRDTGHVQSNVMETLFRELRERYEEKGLIKNTSVTN